METFFASQGLEDTVYTDAGLTLKEKAKAAFLLQQHLAPQLKNEYMNEINPRKLWEHLKARFDHMREIWLSEEIRDWHNVHVMDHTSIANYKSVMFRITSQLEMFGHPVNDADKIDKTLSTFYEANIALVTQYRNMNFTTYFDLIAHLLVEEEQQIVALHNARKCPARIDPPPHRLETHYGHTYERRRGNLRGRIPFKGGKSKFRGQGKYHNPGRSPLPEPRNTWKRGMIQGRGRWRNPQTSTSDTSQKLCYRCGKIGHIKKYCRATDTKAQRHTNERNNIK